MYSDSLGYFENQNDGEHLGRSKEQYWPKIRWHSNCVPLKSDATALPTASQAFD